MIRNRTQCSFPFATRTNWRTIVEKRLTLKRLMTTVCTTGKLPAPLTINTAVLPLRTSIQARSGRLEHLLGRAAPGTAFGWTRWPLQPGHNFDKHWRWLLPSVRSLARPVCDLCSLLTLGLVLAGVGRRAGAVSAVSRLRTRPTHGSPC